MPWLYSRADIVLPYSAAEVWPHTVGEAFLAGKPTIVDAIGMTQSVPKNKIGEMVEDFGLPSGEFEERHGDEYLAGDHFIRCEGGPEKVAETILELYNDEGWRSELGNRASEWANEYEKHWSLKDKGEKLLEVAGLD